MKLQDILLKTQNLTDVTKCPVCKNKTCMVGEYVEHAKVGPDGCFVCGWSESNGTKEYPDNTDYVTKCWQLQIPPYEALNLDQVF